MTARMALMPLDPWLHLRRALTAALTSQTPDDLITPAERQLRTALAACDAGWLNLQPHMTDMARYLDRG